MLKLNERLQASALFYAITVAFIVAMMLGSLVLLAHYRTERSLRWVAHEQVASNARSGVYVAMGRTALNDGPETTELFNGTGDCVTTEVRSYGGLDLVFSTAWKADQRATTMAVVGAAFENNYVLDLGKGAGPLHVCGNTHIKGNVRVPMADVRRGYIEGRPFTGEQLVDGQVLRSPQDPVGSNTRLSERIRHIAAGSPFFEEQVVILELGHPFNAGVKDQQLGTPVVEFRGKTHLRGYDIRGPLVIRCNDSLSIDADNFMELVVIQAPFIAIDPSARLSAQCIASAGIMLGEDAQLLYPSLLAVWRDEHQSEAARIELQRGSLVQGAVIAVDRSVRDRDQGSIAIAEDALVQGEVYAEGAVELKGGIKGTLIARDLILRTPSSIYRGHLMDAVLEPYDLGAPIGFGCTGTTTERTVLQWGKLQHSTPES